MRVLLALLAFPLLLPAAAQADDADKPKPYVIATQDDPQLPSGALARISGFVDGKGPLMELRDLTPWQPIMLQIISHDKATRLHVKVSKPGGTDIIFEGDTDQDGVSVAKFRSHHSVDIVVTSSTGRKGFSLVAWIGPAIAPPMQSILRTIE